MNHSLYSLIRFFVLLIAAYSSTLAQNPLVTDQFTADPTARVFNGKVYVYPSHDIPCTESRGRVGWFCMEDYHVFSSSNLTDWTDHGVIVSQEKVDWVNPTGYSMWAPDCIEKNGKYYFYFPAGPKDTITYGRGFMVGVAVADKPEGPYMPQPAPIKGVRGIDPNVFIDKDGQAYLYWAARDFYVAKLKDNMLELASEPQKIDNLPEKGLKEGPFLFERNGIYYLTYPHVEDKTERLEYAIGNSPVGPFKVTGVIMEQHPSGCWTNHQSMIEFEDQWYLFYHHNDLSPGFDKNRSIRADSMFFNEDGTIKEVKPTLRGVGVTGASEKIQIDRYSVASDKGVSAVFIDTLNKFGGWKVVLTSQKSWVQYNSVNFENKKYKNIVISAASKNGVTVNISTDKSGKKISREIKLPAGSDLKTYKFPVKENIPAGIHNIIVSLESDNEVEIDWISFE